MKSKRSDDSLPVVGTIYERRADANCACFLNAELLPVRAGCKVRSSHKEIASTESVRKEALSRLATAQEALRELEWVGPGQTCPYCTGRRGSDTHEAKPHMATCVLARALGSGRRAE